MTFEGGPISSGTHRTVDLVPAFLDALVELDRAAASEIIRSYGPRIEQIKAHTDTLDIDPDEDDGELLNDLDVALNIAAPEGFYFGAAEGDGACFGFWAVDAD